MSNRGALYGYGSTVGVPGLGIDVCVDRTVSMTFVLDERGVGVGVGVEEDARVSVGVADGVAAIVRVAKDTLASVFVGEMALGEGTPLTALAFDIPENCTNNPSRITSNVVATSASTIHPPEPCLRPSAKTTGAFSIEEMGVPSAGGSAKFGHL